MTNNVPLYLQKYSKLYLENPRQANIEWFKQAKYGLFIHYGLFSLSGIHPFEQWKNKIHVADYEKKKEIFTAEKFDANYITDLALEAGMKYINFVTKHCEGFSLWDTKQSNFNSVNSAAKRDLVAEMAEACHRKGIGLFLFYEHGFDWRHAHAPRLRDFNTSLVQVPYEDDEPFYAKESEYNLQHYVDFVSAQVTELLTNYGPIAGIWLDGVRVPLTGDHNKFKLQELYDLIHHLSPHAIVSYKRGVTGTEDFLAPEYVQLYQLDPATSDKPLEICDTFLEEWGYAREGKRRNADYLISGMAAALINNANLLFNIGPMPDGSIHPEEEQSLRSVGKTLRSRFS